MPGVRKHHYHRCTECDGIVDCSCELGPVPNNKPEQRRRVAVARLGNTKHAAHDPICRSCREFINEYNYRHGLNLRQSLKLP